MSPDIRTEAPGDGDAILAVHDAAFGGPAEGRLVDGLRRDGNLLLSLVAVEENAIVGHIAFSRLRISDGAPDKAVALAPLAVLPARQGRGIGVSLTENGLERLARAGETLVFVLGDPAYYGRFGFSAAAARPYGTPWPGDAFQALWLGAPVSDPGGMVHYGRAFSAFED